MKLHYEKSSLNPLIVGCGKSGIAACHLLQSKGLSPFLYDDDKDKAHDVEASYQPSAVLDETKPLVSCVSFVVTSPGISLEHPILQEAKESKIEIIGEVELAIRLLEWSKVIGITGTNGKTTLTSLLYHVFKNTLNDCVEMYGNIGNPLSLASKMDTSLVELSSFQLDTTSTPFLDIGVLLNISTDHLDRYPDMNGYADSKCSIGNLLKDHGEFVVSSRVWESYQNKINDSLKSPFQTIKVIHPPKQEWIDEFNKLGVNNLLLSGFEGETVLIAEYICQKWGISKQDFVNAVVTFKKPEHRMEWVRSREGIEFFNDSKATNPDAVEKGIKAFKNKVHLIVGGESKGCQFFSWKVALKKNVIQVYALGEAKELLSQQLEPELSVTKVDSLKSALEAALKLARRGENIILSPGCSSFDMFENYEDRGRQFKNLVLSL
jgi:UDP-N-acetylmuramoylalanine--D-glutamate ligase